MAHHDTVPGSPGAADDAMGIAVALEVARAIRAQGQPHRDLILLFTDSEELGLDGSRAFFAQNPLAERTGMIINLEARGGEVTIATSRSANGGVRIVVADTGRGMNDQEVAHAFDDFYTTKPDGTGLGLSVVRRLTADMNGSVRVESQPGRGTTFTIELPACTPS